MQENVSYSPTTLKNSMDWFEMHHNFSFMVTRGMGPVEAHLRGMPRELERDSYSGFSIPAASYF